MQREFRNERDAEADRATVRPVQRAELAAAELPSSPDRGQPPAYEPTVAEARATESGSPLVAAPANRALAAQAAVQAYGSLGGDDVGARAAEGVAGASSALPHHETIQAAFGRHDVSGVRAHTGPEAGDAATSIGAKAYATGNDVAFGGPSPDLHLAAHEAAHVVQQRGGVHLKGGVGQAGDAHEQHADAVADAVVAGRSAEPLLDQYQGGGAAPGVQRFEAEEHRDLGNEGSGSRDVKLADNYALQYGQMTALAGDHFLSIQQMRAFATKATGPESREEIEYALEWKLKEKGRKYSEAAKTAQIARYYALAKENNVHFLNPDSGDQQRSTVEKTTEVDVNEATKRNPWTPKGKPHNAAAAYRMNHVTAINEAMQAGAKKQDIAMPMASDAFGSHFLTDAFSSGHVRTERTDIPLYWNERVPMFFYNFVGYLAEKIAHALTGGKFSVVSDDAKVHGTLGQKGSQEIVGEKIRAKGVIGFGDIVATALHDYDNATGVDAMSEGKKVSLKGDGQLGKGDEKHLAVRAVSLSVADVEKAYELGKSGKTTADELLGEDHMFAPERLIPTLDGTPDAKNPALNWRTSTPRELLTIPHFRKALFIFCQEKKSDLLEVGKELGGPKEEALKKSIVAKLGTEADCVELIWGVLNWTPNTGGGIAGQNQDDNAAEYYDAAAKIKNGVQSLTTAAREALIRDLMDGKTWKDEEQRIWYLLEFATAADAHTVIKNIGWEKIYDELEDGEHDKFKKRFPKAYYGK